MIVASELIRRIDAARTPAAAEAEVEGFCARRRRRPARPGPVAPAPEPGRRAPRVAARRRAHRLGAGRARGRRANRATPPRPARARAPSATRSASPRAWRRRVVVRLRAAGVDARRTPGPGDPARRPRGRLHQPPPRRRGRPRRRRPRHRRGGGELVPRRGGRHSEPHARTPTAPRTAPPTTVTAAVERRSRDLANRLAATIGPLHARSHGAERGLRRRGARRRQPADDALLRLLPHARGGAGAAGGRRPGRRRRLPAPRRPDRRRRLGRDHPATCAPGGCCARPPLTQAAASIQADHRAPAGPGDGADPVARRPGGAPSPVRPRGRGGGAPGAARWRPRSRDEQAQAGHRRGGRHARRAVHHQERRRQRLDDHRRGRPPTRCGAGARRCRRPLEPCASRG